MSMRSAIVIRTSAVAIALLAGCSSQISAPTTAPVRGVVKYKGKPLAGISVSFHPQFNIGSVKFTPSGLTGPNGEFTLSTAAAGDGAPPGEYVVTFEFLQVQSDRASSGIEKEVDLLKGKYSDPSQSKWRLQIHKGENILEPFNLD